MPSMKIGVLVSGRGSNLQALIDHFAPDTGRTGLGGSPVEIALVLSNRPDAQAIARARAAGIPASVIDHKTFSDRADFEAAMTAALQAAGVEIVVLAGFMRLLGDAFIAAWPDRLVNIHPALLPAFRGLDTHARAIAAGVRFHGCTVHFVRPEVDSGPIIAQAAVPVLPDDTPEILGRRVLAAEHRLYPLALRLLAEGKVAVKGEKAIIRDAAFAGGVFLNPLGA